MKSSYSDNPFVSIIIPLHWGLKEENFDRFIKDFNKYFLNLDYKRYEILLITEKPAKLPKFPRFVKHLVMNPKKPTGPAEKRDYALKFAKGEICAFIDDDAYPQKDWLKQAVKWFRNPDIIGVGGPGVTPPDNSYWQKIGGNIIESYFCSGGVQYRFRPGKLTTVDDYPAYNMLVRTDILKKVGGYGSTFYGGEDTFLCIKLIKYGLIIYDPKAVVFHHRRAFLIPHLKQIKSVAIHRGYFFKKFPETSRTPIYILPTLLTFGLIAIVISVILNPLVYFWPFVFLMAFMLLLAAFSVRRKNTSWPDALVASLGIIATHLTYGTFFIRGLLKETLEQ